LQTYTVMIEQDRETGWLVGEVVELPGCYTEAPDLQSLKANLEEAILAYREGVDPEDLIPVSTFVGALRIKHPASAPLSG